MSDLQFQIPEQTQLQTQNKRKGELLLVQGHLVRMKCEAGNLKTCIEREDFVVLMTAIVEGLRHAAILIESYISEL